MTPEDYAAKEKTSNLPKRLSTKGEPSSYKPLAGDVTYYAPWGNLANFHKNFGYSSSLIKLGKVDSGMESLRCTGPMKATINLISE